MNSKEKAKELVDKMYYAINENKGKPFAKQCAIICAKEIMKTDWYIPNLSAAIDWKIIYETIT